MDAESLIGPSMLALLAGLGVLLYGVSLNNGQALNARIAVGTVLVIVATTGLATAADRVGGGEDAAH